MRGWIIMAIESEVATKVPIPFSFFIEYSHQSGEN